ncbi:hypothetical protein U1Q18_014599, partial [Sarracenia purpurea var. burkii]
MTTSGLLVSPNRFNALQSLGDDGKTGPNPSRVLATFDSKMTVNQTGGVRSNRGRSEVPPVKARLASLAKRIQFLKGLSPLKPKSEWMISASPEAHIDKDTEDENEASDSEDSEEVVAGDAVEDDANEADLGEVEAEHEQGISSSRLGQVISLSPAQDCGMDIDLKREPVVAIKENQLDVMGGSLKSSTP